jgi:hypothetical protein
VSDRKSEPAVEPLASRLEHAARVEACRHDTELQLDELVARDPRWRVFLGAWVRGVHVHFIVVGPPGVFLVWAFDRQSSTEQAALVMPARRQIQAELGKDWPGKVEVIFHHPGGTPKWDRFVVYHDAADELIDVVHSGADLGGLLETWHPEDGVWLDERWLEWLAKASEPRWWIDPVEEAKRSRTHVLLEPPERRGIDR